MKLSSGGWKILGFAAVFAVGVGFAYNQLNKKEKLPVYDPADLNPKLVDKGLQSQKSGHHIQEFQLQNQNGETVTLKNLEGKIYVVDFFFTTCQSICPKMTSQLTRVAAAFKNEDRFRIVSHTVDPETDSVSVLKEYATANNVDAHQWLMLTGSKEQIYNLARKSYFVVFDEPSQEGPDFIHTENFALVDSKKQIRGYYDGTSKAEVDKLIKDIKILLEEEND